MATYQLGGLGRIKGSSAAEGLTQAAVDKQEQQKRLQNMRINQQRMQAAAYRANRQRINDARNDEARREAIRQANNLPDVSNFSDGNANFPISRKTLQLPAPVVGPVPAPVPQVQQVGPPQMSPVLAKPFNLDQFAATPTPAASPTPAATPAPAPEPAPLQYAKGLGVLTPDALSALAPYSSAAREKLLQYSEGLGVGGLLTPDALSALAPYSSAAREKLLQYSKGFGVAGMLASPALSALDPSASAAREKLLQDQNNLKGSAIAPVGEPEPAAQQVGPPQMSPVLTPAKPFNLDQVAGITEKTAGSVIPVSEVVSATQGSPSQMYLQNPYFARRSREENVQRQRILQDQIKLDALRGNYDEIAERRIAYNAAQTEGLYLDAMVALTSVREGSFGPIENLLQKMYPNDNVVLKPYDDGTLEVFLDGEQLEEIKTNEDLVNFIRPDVDRRFLAEQESTRQSLMTAQSDRLNKLFENGLEANIEILKNAGVINVEILRGEIDKAIATIRSKSGGSDFGAWEFDSNTGQGFAYTDDGRYMIRIEQSTDPVTDEITARHQMYEIDRGGVYRRLSDFGN